VDGTVCCAAQRPSEIQRTSSAHELHGHLQLAVTPMNMHESFTFTPSVALPSKRNAPARSSLLKLLRMRLVAWLKKSADAYSDAVVYENLSRLSDAELKHRDLSRDILARDVGDRASSA